MAEPMKRPPSPAKVKAAEENPDCGGCQAALTDPMYPSHTPSSYCESGKRPHCTCDRCY